MLFAVFKVLHLEMTKNYGRFQGATVRKELLFSLLTDNTFTHSSGTFISQYDLHERIPDLYQVLDALFADLMLADVTNETVGETPERPSLEEVKKKSPLPHVKALAVRLLLLSFKFFFI